MSGSRARLSIRTRPQAERRVVFFVAILAMLQIGLDAISIFFSPHMGALLKGLGALTAALIAAHSEMYKLRRSR